MQELIGGRIAGGGKRETTGGRPAAETGVDWLKQQALLVQRCGASVKQENPVWRPAGKRGRCEMAEAAGIAGPEAWHRCGKKEHGALVAEHHPQGTSPDIPNGHQEKE